jgi:uncharacterized membrane protein (DUF4010 family)
MVAVRRPAGKTVLVSTVDARATLDGLMGTAFPLLTESAIAIAIGLTIGLEREHGELTGPEHANGKPLALLLGVRSFALLALFGWLCAFAGDTYAWLPPAALLVAGALVILGFLRAPPTAGHGLTTEIAALTTFLLGLLVHVDRRLAVALGLGTTLLLISKPFFQSFLPKLRRVDLTSTLQLLLVLAVVLPLLPDKPVDPWGVLEPRKLGLLVALIAAISWVGYVLNRLFGQRRGAGLTGLVGGLASSTAVTAAMAQDARRAPSMIAPGQLAVFLACTVMLARVEIVTAVISRPVALTLALPLGLMALGMLAGAAWKWSETNGAPLVEDRRALELQNPFSLLSALKWASLLSIIFVASAGARRLLGDAGLFAAAAASGLADVDAITLAVSKQAAVGEVADSVAALSIIIAIISNTISKAVIAWITGGRAFGADIAKIFAGATVVGAGAALARYFFGN